MPGSAEMIQFINRDEESMIKHFTYMANTIKSEQPELWTKDFQILYFQNFKAKCKDPLLTEGHFRE